MLNVILFVGTYAFGLLFAVFQNPAYAFVLYEAVYFFSPAQRWWSFYLPDISYSFFTVVLMAFVLFVRYRKQQAANKIFAAPQFKWVYLVVLLYAATWFISVNPELHFQAAINFIKLLVIISIAYKLIDTTHKLDLAIWGYIFGSWYISFLTYQTGRNSYNRVEGIGTVDAPDSNGIAAAIAPSLVLSLCYFWIMKPKYCKLLFAFAGVFIANALILINSRGAFLGVFVSVSYFMFYLYFSSVQRKYQKAAALWITIAGIAGVIYLADESVVARIQTMKNTEIVEEQQTATTRFIFWLAAWDMAKDYPFGAGNQGFDYYAPVYVDENVDTGFSRNRSVHSTWFEALTETGYLGFSLLILMTYSSFRASRKCIAKLKARDDFENYFKVVGIQAALLSFMASMTFLNRYRAELLYWLVLYSACAYNIYVIKASDTEKRSADEYEGNLRKPRSGLIKSMH